MYPGHSFSVMVSGDSFLSQYFLPQIVHVLVAFSGLVGGAVPWHHPPDRVNNVFCPSSPATPRQSDRENLLRSFSFSMLQFAFYLRLLLFHFFF